MTNEARNRLRNRAGALAAQLRAADPQTAVDAPVDDHGRRVFLSCLVDDTVHDVARLVNRVGGGAMVYAFDLGDAKDWSLALARFTVSETHAEDDCPLPVGPASTLADLFRLLTPGASMTLRLHGDAMWIDSRGEQAVDREAAQLAEV